MGLVTWSSIMSGLRSQRENTITCVSPRSGIASAGMCSIDQAPAAQAAATRKKTSAFLRIEKPISCSIMPVCRPIIGNRSHVRLPARHISPGRPETSCGRTREQKLNTLPLYVSWNAISLALMFIPQTGSCVPPTATGASAGFPDALACTAGFSVACMRLSESSRKFPDTTTRSPSLIPPATTT